MLTITHHGGFFSSCSVRLCRIIHYFLDKKELPNIVDTSKLYYLYNTNESVDNTFDFFEHYDNINEQITYEKHIDIDLNNYQFTNIKEVDYKPILLFVKKYFTPSKRIIDKQNELISKYKINVNNCIGLYYRGTDKRVETQIDSFESYYNILCELLTRDNNLQILIQTDSGPFLDFMKSKNLNNVIIIDEISTSYQYIGIHNENSREKNYTEIQTLFATFLIMSKCKYIICSSCNPIVWMMYYRGNSDNIYQNLDTIWY